MFPAAAALALQRRGVKNVIYPPHAATARPAGVACFARLRKRRVALIGAQVAATCCRTNCARGARVGFVNAYERARPGRRHLRARGCAAPLISLFSSADALTNLHAVLSPPLFAHLAANDCVVSSPRIAEVAHTLGFARLHVAASAEPAALLERACIVMALHRL